jgi:hypothetical protein
MIPVVQHSGNGNVTGAEKIISNCQGVVEEEAQVTFE